MCVFDHIPTDDDYARPKSIAAYASSLHTDGDSIEAAKTLPEFEKRSWSKTRPLYAINRNSRGAALKLQLCMHVLRTSKKPLVPSEWRRTFRRFLIQPFPSVQIIAPVVPAPAHQYIAVELSAQGMSGPEFLIACEFVHQNAAAKQHLDLTVARRVVLLTGPTAAQNMQTTSVFPQDIRDLILDFWQRNDILDGTVEIWT
jgi:hypothetical protein